MQINDWKIAGGGIQGNNYFSESHPDLVMKVYSKNFKREYVEQELELCKSFLSCGFSCPEAYDVVKYDGCFGIISQRIHNKKSFCRIVSEDPQLMPQLAARMAILAKEVHSRSSLGTPFPSFLDKLQNILNNDTHLDSATHKILQDTIDELYAEESHTILHGDMHFGNIINDGNKDYFIDLGSLSYGNPIFDISMFYLVTHFSSDKLNMNNYHITIQQGLEFWNEFKKDYYGEDIPDEELFKTYRKYLILRSLWMILNTDFIKLSHTLINLFANENCPHYADFDEIGVEMA